MIESVICCEVIMRSGICEIGSVDIKWRWKVESGSGVAGTLMICKLCVIFHAFIVPALAILFVRHLQVVPNVKFFSFFSFFRPWLAFFDFWFFDFFIS